MKKDTFSLKVSYYESVKDLSDTQLGQLMRAIFLYTRENKEPSIDDQVVKVAFRFIRADIDAERAKHEQRCRRNRENIQKRWMKKRKSASKAQEADNNNSALAESNTVQCKVDYDKLLHYWNSRIEAAGAKLPKVCKITGARRRLVKNRLAEFNNDTRVVRNVFEKAFASPYLNGKNQYGWIANFDWIMQGKNFSRILEDTFTKKKEARNIPNVAQIPVPHIDIQHDAKVRAEQKEQRNKQNVERQRNNILAAIRAAESDPHCLHAKVAYKAYADGLLPKLGIVWTPSSLSMEKCKEQ